MPSPLPGMDPYIEGSGLWPDFHESFIIYWRDAISDLLPDHYEIRIDERMRLVAVSPEEAQRIYPDLGHIDRRPHLFPASRCGGAEQVKQIGLPPSGQYDRRGLPELRCAHGADRRSPGEHGIVDRFSDLRGIRPECLLGLARRELGSCLTLQPAVL
ncbi:MAG: DUF4058 family protein [Gemmataceae bacterium]|nr:DUF4058 family protein [Gemmataceae bacterium]